ncbi:hypothetical protein Tco_0443448 [Tanacetum coccineum]
MIKRSKCENKGIVPTEMELVLEYTQQGASHEVSDHLKMEMEMEIPSVKASANSDIIFFFTSAQDGNKLLDDERLSLADDLKKAHDQNQNKGQDMALPPREQRHRFLRYEGLEYIDSDIADFESRMAMEHRDEAGIVVFTSQAWRRLFNTKGPLVWELILSTLRFGDVLLDLDAPGTIQFQLGRAKRRLSWRQFILALGLHTGEEMESPDFASPIFEEIYRWEEEQGAYFWWAVCSSIG